VGFDVGIVGDCGLAFGGLGILEVGWEGSCVEEQLIDDAWR